LQLLFQSINQSINGPARRKASRRGSSTAPPMGFAQILDRRDGLPGGIRMVSTNLMPLLVIILAIPSYFSL